MPLNSPPPVYLVVAISPFLKPEPEMGFWVLMKVLSGRKKGEGGRTRQGKVLSMNVLSEGV